MSATLLELAERVEAATGPDRVIDNIIWALIAPDEPWIVGNEPGPFPQKAIYGTRSDMLEWLTGDKAEALNGALPSLQYTASLDAAMTLLGECIYIEFRRFDDGTFGCDIEAIGVKVNTVSATATSYALALTAAALKARALATQGDLR